ncbi:MAG: histone deacetylase family protein [Candidatus Kinetoplastibacterium crithidii]|nr:MAG: histone deacetylase family protein [Candidatus Kinetoplastibacterium crithidii]
MKTMYVTHPSSLKHEMGYFHPDSPERIHSISDQMLASGLMSVVKHGYSFKALKKDILRVHSSTYWDYLYNNIPANGEYYYIDNDTIMNSYTFKSALYAAGSGLFAIDTIFSDNIKNAFCAIRPPGHHASRNNAMGSCFFNNVAIAAKYAFDKYNIRRLAIIDFDAHHGNGTEEIFYDDDRVLMCSFFQHPFYPYLGKDSLKKNNMCNIPINAYTRINRIKDLVNNHWVPAIHKHKPEIILISAGFDAHKEDDMSQICLTEYDYAWITNVIVDLSEQYSNGRIVSILEGGYNLSSLSRSVVLHIRALANI